MLQLATICAAGGYCSGTAMLSNARGNFSRESEFSPDIIQCVCIHAETIQFYVEICIITRLSDTRNPSRPVHKARICQLSILILCTLNRILRYPELERSSRPAQ